MAQIVEVIVDTKEKSAKPRIIQFFKNKGLKVTEASNKDGDLIIILSNGVKIYYERKTYPDFAGSYNSSHLQDQCLRLSNYDFKYVIIHGKFHDIRKDPTLSHMTLKSFYKQVQNIQTFYGTPVATVDNLKEYCEFALTYAEVIINKKDKPLRGLKKINNKQTKRVDINLLMSYDSIGEKKAELLLKQFGSPKNVLEATEKELLDIDGIGKIMVKNLKKLKHIYDNGC